MLEGQCPYCGERIELDKILNVSYDPAPSGEDKSEKLPQKPPPTIEPSAQRVGLSGFVILLIAAGGLGLLGLCGFGGFLGYQQFLAPSGDAMVTPWVTQAPEQALIASTATSVPTSKPTTIPAPTQTPRPTSIPKPTSIPFPSPTPCAFSVSSRFAAAWNQYADQLGCPINQSHSHDAATQDYERGFLLWRVQPDQVYVMHDDGRLGLYPMAVYPESVRQNPPGGDPNIHPPDGLQQPVRGFGLVWRDNPEVRDGVGWAVEGEARADWYYGFEAQDFVGGTILHECRMGVRVLLSSGTWIKISEGDPCG